MKRILLHPLPVRIWHWLNAITVVALILTGFRFRVPGMAAFTARDPLFQWHQWAGILMAALWVFWLAYGLASGALRRHYRPRGSDLRGIAGQVKFYLVSVFRGEKNPFQPAEDGKFNPLQKVAYGAMMGVAAPAMIVTGLLFAHGSLLFGRPLTADAVRVIAALHVAGLYMFSLFLIVHVYMATLGETWISHIRAMVVGYAEIPGNTPQGKAAATKGDGTARGGDDPAAEQAAMALGEYEERRSPGSESTG